MYRHLLNGQAKPQEMLYYSFGLFGESGRGGNQNEPYPDEFGDVLKAYIAHYLDGTYGSGKQKSNGTVAGSLQAIRKLTDALYK